MTPPLPNGAPIAVRVPLSFPGAPFDEIYSMDAPDGWQFHWNVSLGMRIALKQCDLTHFSPGNWDITTEEIHRAYHALNVALNVEYALACDLSRPLLFLMFRGKPQLVDGWHRLYKAVVTGAQTLPAYLLPEEEAGRILVLALPPGQGLDWGQLSAPASMP